jgi:hypothetical protein
MPISQECQQWLSWQANQFMEPFFEHFSRKEIKAINADIESEDEKLSGPGWYGRLSAPGYLDCTDWTGPHSTEDEAAEALFELYGDDFDPTEDEAAAEID